MDCLLDGIKGLANAKTKNSINSILLSKTNKCLSRCCLMVCCCTSFKSCTLVNNTLLNLRKLNKWIKIGIDTADKANKIVGLANLIFQK